jgi:type I restriction-modification system DNA methylase subunit
MSNGVLQDIIENFSPDKFPRFFREKNRSFSPRQESYSQYNDEYFSYVSKLGEIKFSEDEKLIVCAFHSTRPLSERNSRKAQYEKGKKILKDTQSDTGIFIFYDTQDNFRFSLIYPEAIGTRRQWSNFRRFTYFVSPELTNKTFLARVGDGDFSSLDKIKDAFSVEKVTKEFYEQYRKLFEALVVDLDKNQTFRNEASKHQINTSDFAKKTLGQIVFLYFLQKKGWLGVPCDKAWGHGDKNFISNLYRRAVDKKENFFNDYLEILFYDTLNNAAREGADPSFSRYFNCRIPFLNGGLFEPEYDWRGTRIYLDNAVFKDIFEVFDRFNFTVEEESPDDKEVAVDPEMLGKVFENLLEENLRKGKGTYYTPREIVHYMCRESLVNYLISESALKERRVRSLILRHESDFSSDEAAKLNQLLKAVKVCDPACGSGAFLVGMLNEIIHARLALDPLAGEYALKKETIQNCVYGVDIDPGAVEIAKLRLWLSLVVDYELADIEPLPNLDYKIMCGNSLLEELIVGEESIKLFDVKLLASGKGRKNDGLFGEIKKGAATPGPRHELLRKALEEKQARLMQLHNSGTLTAEKRRELDSEIVTLNKELNPRVKRKKGSGTHPSLFQEKAGHYFDVLRDLHKKYFNEYDTHKKKAIRQQIEDIEFEFIKSSIEERVMDIDVQIKNLNMQKPEDRKKNVALMKKKLEYMAVPNNIRRAKVRPYFLWHLNFFEVFQEKGGFDVVIANPPYVRVDEIPLILKGAFKKQFRSAVGKYDLYYLFIEKSSHLIREEGVLVFITPNKYCAASSASGLRELIFFIMGKYEIVSTSKLSVFEQAANYPVISIFQKTQDKSSIVVREALSIEQLTESTPSVYKLRHEQFKKFPETLIPINVDQRKIDLVTRLLGQSSRLGDFLSISEGLRIPAKYETEQGSDFGIVKQYQFEKWSIIKRGTFISTRHLRSVVSEASSRYQKIIQPKILIAEDALMITATVDDDHQVPQGGVYFGSIINNLNIRIILGLLNSRLLSAVYEILFGGMHMGGGYLRYRTKFLEELPVVALQKMEAKKIQSCVDQILSLKQRNPEADTGALELQIDQMVYKLYGLTEEEIRIVERTNK